MRSHSHSPICACSRVCAGRRRTTLAVALQAHADGTTTEVALKLPSRVCSKRDLERFELEISTMEALHHPNIVRIVGSVWRPSIMLVLEWMPGGSLHVVLAQGGKVGAERAALDVASGMAARSNGPSWWRGPGTSDPTGGGVASQPGDSAQS